MIKKIWNNITAKETANGKYLITHNYIYRNEIKDIYAPEKSNIIEAKCHSKKIIQRCEKKGKLEILNQQVDKAISKQMLQELTKEEVLNLTSKIHHFSYFNWVENSNSASTPFRLICNTSNQHSQTTMSIEQMTPAQILNNMEVGLIRFQLYAVPLVADIQGA